MFLTHYSSNCTFDHTKNNTQFTIHPYEYNKNFMSKKQPGGRKSNFAASVDGRRKSNFDVHIDPFDMVHIHLLYIFEIITSDNK